MQILVEFMRRDSEVIKLAEVLEFLDLAEAIAELLNLHLEVLLVCIEAIVEFLTLCLAVLLALGKGGGHLLRPDLHVIVGFDVDLLVHVTEAVQHLVVLLNDLELGKEDFLLGGSIHLRLLSVDKLLLISWVVLDCGLHVLESLDHGLDALDAPVVRLLKDFVPDLLGLLTKLVLELLRDDAEDAEVNLVL